MWLPNGTMMVLHDSNLGSCAGLQSRTRLRTEFNTHRQSGAYYAKNARRSPFTGTHQRRSRLFKKGDWKWEPKTVSVFDILTLMGRVNL